MSKRIINLNMTAVMLVVLVVAFFAGYGYTKEPAPPPTLAAAPTSAPKSTPPRTPPAPKPEGKLVVSMTFMEFIPDPLLTRNTQKPFMELIFDPLVGKTNDAKLSTETGIAQKWEISADGKAHTFYLRKGVKFHNGEELTAEDVKFSIDRVIGPKSVSGYAGSLRAYIAKVEIADPYKVVVHTKVPAPDLEFYLSSLLGTDGSIVPKKYIEEKGDDYFVKNPIGSGPYKVKEIVVGSRMELEAIDKHWRVGVPKYRTIVLNHVTEESTRIAQLKRGEADLIEVSRERATEVKKAGYSLFTKPIATQVRLNFYEMWDKDSPLGDIKVREALELAINKKEIVDTLFQGQATPASIGGCSPPDPTWDEKLYPLRPYDPEKAKRLMAEYGRPVRIKFYSYPRAGVPELKSTVEAIVGYWEKVGVKAEIVSMDYESFRRIWLAGAKGHKDMKPAAGGGGVGAVSAHPLGAQLWYTATDYKAFHSGEIMDWLGTPEVDKILDEVMAQTSWDKMVKAGKEWQKYKYDNFYTPGIVNLGSIFAANEKIRKWEFPPDEYAMGWDYLISRK